MFTIRTAGPCIGRLLRVRCLSESSTSSGAASTRHGTKQQLTGSSSGQEAPIQEGQNTRTGVLRPISVVAQQKLVGWGQKEHRLDPADSDCFTDVGIRRPFGVKNDIFRQYLRQFLEDFEDGHEYINSRKPWLRLAERNLLGVTIPPEYGGPGGSLLELAVLLEEQCYGKDPVPTLWLHEAGARCILRHGSSRQKEALLPKLCEGTHIITACTTDLGCREGLTRLQCVATGVTSGWKISGRVMTPHDVYSDLLLLPVATQPASHVDESDMTGLSLLLVHPDQKSHGLRKEILVHDMNNRSMDSTVYYFDDYFVPEECLLGALNDGFHIIQQDYAFECYCVAIRNLSYAEKLFETARGLLSAGDFTKRSPVINKQNIQKTLGQMKSEISIVRMAMDQMIENVDKGSLRFNSAAVLKSQSAELEERVATNCLELLGGSAKVWGSDLARECSRSVRNRLWSADRFVALEKIGAQVILEQQQNNIR